MELAGELGEVQGEFGVELEGIGPLLLKEGVGWLGQQRKGVRNSKSSSEGREGYGGELR